ncbi:hypothetical protein HNP46_006373 [Pseudomonas nitritireducens]|uniref:Uncharacterized protein n=1 Tax=Pseudomonas nitroreducens TaxID=46680 RepID=A0A7W7KR59_PSENT|nr:hypothetical protein [Pseudomonas nitritireducens]MBB4867460.1 hypothetical protein [Pseudomonas nitritireducens]
MSTPPKILTDDQARAKSLYRELVSKKRYDGSACRDLANGKALEAEQLSLIEELPAELVPGAMTEALLLGDLPLAKEIWARRKPFAVEITYDKAHVLQNGSSVEWMSSLPSFLMVGDDVDKLGVLFELIREVKADGLIGANGACSLMFQYSSMGAAESFCTEEPANSGAQIPELSAGQVTRSAMVWALAEKWYSGMRGGDELLCWVDSAMVPNFPEHLHPYRPVREVVYHDLQDAAVDPHTSKYKLFRCDLDAFDAEMAAQSQPAFFLSSALQTDEHPWTHRYLVSSIDLKIAPAYGSPKDVDHFIVGTFLPEQYRRGFSFPKGKVLCRTTAAFLREFAVEAPDDTALQVAREAIRNYAPLARIAQCNASSPGKPDYALEHSKHSGFAFPRVLCSDLIKACDTTPLGQAYLTEVPKHLQQMVIRELALGCKESKLMHRANAYFGVKTNQVKLMLTPKEALGIGVDDTGRPTYRLAVSTSLEIDKADHTMKDGSVFYQAVRKALRYADGAIFINDIDTSLDAPDVLLGCVGKESNHDVAVYREIARHRGLESFVQYLESPAQWEVATSVFPAGDFIPYADQVPDKLITSIASDILEL